LIARQIRIRIRIRIRSIWHPTDADIGWLRHIPNN